MVPPPGVSSPFGDQGAGTIPPPAVLGMVNPGSIMGATSGVVTPPIGMGMTSSPAVLESSELCNGQYILLYCT